MSSNISIEQKVLDGEQVGPVKVSFTDGADLVGEVQIQDRLLNGEGTEININVSDSLGVVGVEELVEINHGIQDSAEKAEAAANKAAGLIDRAEEERIALEKNIQHIQDLSDKTEKNAAIATNKAAEATQQAEIATNQADSAIQSKNEANRQAVLAGQKATIATDKANIATQQASIATSKADTASSQAKLATSKAEEAKASASEAKKAADKAAKDTSDRLEAHFANQVAEATKQANIATTQADIAQNNAASASTSASSAKAEADKAEHQANLAKAQAQAAATNNSDAKAHADRAKREADRSASQVPLATRQAEEAKRQATAAKTQADLSAQSANAANQSKLAAAAEVTKAANAGSKAVQDKFNSIEPILNQKVTDATSQANRAKAEADKSATSAGTATSKANIAITKATEASNSAKAALASKDAAAVSASAASSAQAASNSIKEDVTNLKADVTALKNQAIAAKDTAVQQAGNAARSASTSTTQADRSKSEADRAKKIADSIQDVAGGKFGVVSINGQAGIIENFDYRDVGAMPASYVPSWGDISGKPNLLSQSTGDTRYFRNSVEEVIGQDWNTLIRAGSYKVTNASGANKPSISGQFSVYPYGTLVVTVSVDVISQIYYPDGRSKSYRRMKYGANAWGSWKPTEGFAEILDTSVDLNNLTMGGTYNMYRGSGVVFTNAPRDFDYGTLQVIGTGTASRSFCTQILTWRSNGRQMIRTRNDGQQAWTPWVKIYSESQKPTASDVGARPVSWVPSWGDITGKPNVVTAGSTPSFSKVNISGTEGFDLEVENTTKSYGSLGSANDWSHITKLDANGGSPDGGIIVGWKAVSGNATNTGWYMGIKGGVTDFNTDLREKGQRVYSPNNKPTINDLNPLITKTKSLRLTADTWTNLLGNIDIPASGVYTILLEYASTGHGGVAYDQHYTGQFYWYSAGTNSNDTSEIPLHHMGHADNNEFIYLRTLSTGGNKGTQQLQIRCTRSFTSNVTFTIKLRRII